MGEVGRVVSADINEGKVKVSMKRNEACAKCRVCIAGMQTSEMLMEATNLCAAKAGDYVEIELKPGFFLKAALIMYGIPLLALLAGIFFGYYTFGEIAAFVFGILLMLASYMLIKKNESKIASGDYVPMAVGIAQKPDGIKEANG